MKALVLIAYLLACAIFNRDARASELDMPLDLQLHTRIESSALPRMRSEPEEFSLVTDPLTWAAMAALLVDWGTTIDMVKRNGVEKRAYDINAEYVRAYGKTYRDRTLVMPPFSPSYHENTWYTAKFVGVDLPHQHRVHKYFAATAAFSLATRALLPAKYSWIPMSIQLGVNAHAGRHNVMNLKLDVKF